MSQTPTIESLLGYRRSNAIYLNYFGGEIECCVCSALVDMHPEIPTFGVPVYESEILHDDDPGEWGGQPACLRCYFLVRGLQERVYERLPISVVRELALRGVPAPRVAPKVVKS